MKVMAKTFKGTKVVVKITNSSVEDYIAQGWHHASKGSLKHWMNKQRKARVIEERKRITLKRHEAQIAAIEAANAKQQFLAQQKQT